MEISKDRFNHILDTLEEIASEILESDNPKIEIEHINAHTSDGLGRFIMYLAYLEIKSRCDFS